MFTLVQLVYEKKDIIKGKFEIGITAKGKKEPWGNIRMEVNAAFPLKI